MTGRDFAFWLQGFLEITSVDERPALSAAQVEVVKKHLALVFVHEIEPSMTTPAAKTPHEKKLDAVHDAPTGHWPSGGPVMRC